MADYRRYFSVGQTVFITAVTHRRAKRLREAMNKRLLLEAMREVKGAYPFVHRAHVILDDHFHWMIRTGHASSNVSRIVYAVKRNFRRNLASRRGVSGPLWQPRFWDHIIRDEQDFRRHLDYIHYNPVKHGYVAMACQYRWSSFHAWMARGVYDSSWGSAEPASVRNLDLE